MASIHEAPVERDAMSSGLFYKTKLCKFNAIGACAKGSACTFAHGPVDMNPLPDFQCTKFCPLVLETGVCNDPACRFAHDRNEIRRRRPGEHVMLEQGMELTTTPLVRQTSGRSSTGSDIGSIYISPAAAHLGKTKMCKFNLLGECTKGSACRYAHSPEELKPLPFSPMVCPEAGVGARLTQAALASNAAKMAKVTSMASTHYPLSDGGESTNASGLVAHQQGEMSDSWSTSSQLGLESVGTPAPSDDTDRPNKALFFKTKMCKFHAKGMCTKGTSCSFAHSPEEMRAVPRVEERVVVQAVKTLPSGEGARVLLQSEETREFFLAVKNGFFTVDVEDSVERGTAKRRGQSLPARITRV